MERKVCLMLTSASLLVPLLSIALAALMASWFNLFYNALSDLGHATRSSVAPIFNFGLSAGGFLVSATAITCAVKKCKLIGVTLAIAGYILVLIAVFDEVYGWLHFYVSVAFFLLIAVLLVEYAFENRGLKGALALLATLVGVVSWFLHLVYRIPPGAAIPELVSIAVAAPFYVEFILRR
ncbi:MAG: DUF998 domain-containing protein [Thermofilaceae archaeon]|nr:DUF998 domain-containing protein [Thermofilaceae archaeon]